MMPTIDDYKTACANLNDMSLHEIAEVYSDLDGWAIVAECDDEAELVEDCIVLQCMIKTHCADNYGRNALGRAIVALERIGGQADRRTGGQADRRTGGQADRRTGGQADRRTGGQADRRTGGPRGSKNARF